MNIRDSALPVDHPAARILRHAGVDEQEARGLAPLAAAAAFSAGTSRVLFAALKVPQHAPQQQAPAGLTLITHRLVVTINAAVRRDYFRFEVAPEPLIIEARDLSDFTGYRLETDPGMWIGEGGLASSSGWFLRYSDLFLLPRTGPEHAVWRRPGQDEEIMTDPAAIQPFLASLRDHGPAGLISMGIAQA